MATAIFQDSGSSSKKTKTFAIPAGAVFSASWSATTALGFSLDLVSSDTGGLLINNLGKGALQGTHVPFSGQGNVHFKVNCNYPWRLTVYDGP